MIFFFSNRMMSLLTFPGVMIHKAAYQFTCNFLGIPVYEISYFAPFTKPAGYVSHEKIEDKYQSYLIIMIPFLINSIICAILLLPIFLPTFLHTDFIDTYKNSIFIKIIHGFFIWIGISNGYNAIPSNKDLLVIPPLPINSPSYFFLFVKFIVAVFNVRYIGPFLRTIYAFALSVMSANIFLKIIK